MNCSIIQALVCPLANVTTLVNKVQVLPSKVTPWQVSLATQKLQHSINVLAIVVTSRMSWQAIGVFLNPCIFHWPNDKSKLIIRYNNMSIMIENLVFESTKFKLQMCTFEKWWSAWRIIRFCLGKLFGFFLKIVWLRLLHIQKGRKAIGVSTHVFFKEELLGNLTFCQPNSWQLRNLLNYEIIFDIFWFVRSKKGGKIHLVYLSRSWSRWERLVSSGLNASLKIKFHIWILIVTSNKAIEKLTSHRHKWFLKWKKVGSRKPDSTIVTKLSKSRNLHINIKLYHLFKLQWSIWSKCDIQTIWY